MSTPIACLAALMALLLAGIGWVWYKAWRYLQGLKRADRRVMEAKAKYGER